jgi:hypothetical protein
MVKRNNRWVYEPIVQINNAETGDLIKEGDKEILSNVFKDSYAAWLGSRTEGSRATNYDRETGL